jgi:ATP-dependent exoDNAse (exonuclease V) beta subunit
MKLIKQDKNLKFKKKKHLYTYNNYELESVTTFLNKFFEPFIAKQVAKKLSNIPKFKAEKKGVRYWLKKWANTQQQGSLIHNEIDEYITTKGLLEVSLPKSAQAVKYINNNDLLNKNLLSEVKIFSIKLKLAGTIDGLYFNSDGSVSLLDWKTSEKIEKESYKGRVGIHNATKNIPDSNYWHYAIQLNLYKKILESEYDLKVSKLSLVHLQDDSYYVFNIPFMEDTVNKMLEERK